MFILNVYGERSSMKIFFLYEYESLTKLKKGIDRYFKFYNTERFHQSLNYNTPDDIYFSNADIKNAS